MPDIEDRLRNIDIEQRRKYYREELELQRDADAKLLAARKRDDAEELARQKAAGANVTKIVQAQLEARKELEKQAHDSAATALQQEIDLFNASVKAKDAAYTNAYKQRSLQDKKELVDSQIKYNEQKQQQLKALKEKHLALAASDEEAKEIEEQYSKRQEELFQEQKDLESRKQRLSKGPQKEPEYAKNILGQETGYLKDHRTLATRTADKVKDAQENWAKAQENLTNAQDDLTEALKSGDEKQIEAAQKQLEEAKEANNIAEDQLEEAENQKELLEDLNTGIQDVMKEASDYMGRLNARLQGTDKTFYSIEKLLDRNLAISPWIKTSDVLTKIAQLSDAGIAYNLEQRAFLESIKDNIATTFSAANGTLLRLIRLQQADTTAARLGMEAALTKFFNSQFNDTSYLSNLADSVADALIEAESVRSYDEAMQFEYTVQKWLGSLSSLGVGQTAIQNLAQGLGWIGSGNITQLQNSPMMTLFAMAASEADIDFAKLFTEGMDESDTNKLLRQIVMYLQEVNSGSGNLVVANALANVFGVTVSDLKGIANLTRGDISNIYKSTLSYSGAMSEVQSQLSIGNMMNRVSIQTMMNNIMDNIVHNMGTTIGGSPFAYGAYRGTDILRSMTGGIHLPAFSVFGNMVDLSAFTIEDIVQMGVMGFSALGSLIGAASSLANGGGLNLSGWGGTQFNKRGGLSTLLPTGIKSGTSMSQYVGSGSGEDVKKQSLTSASEDEDTESISSSKFEDKWDFDKWLEEWDLKSDKAMPVRFTGDAGLPVMIFSGMNDNEIWNSIKLDERTQRGIADKVLEKLGKNIGEKDLKTMLEETQFKTDNSALATFATGLSTVIGGSDIDF